MTPEQRAVASNDEKVRANYIGWPAWEHLNRFGGYVTDAFDGHHPYLVGSSLRRRDYRDVDVRLVLPDDEFEALFGQLHKPHYLMPKWNAHCIAWTHFGIDLTGLPIDFQIDQMTEANELYDGGRSALGLRITRWAGEDNDDDSP